jgi:hypothetical protein
MAKEEEAVLVRERVQRFESPGSSGESAREAAFPPTPLEAPI